MNLFVKNYHARCMESFCLCKSELQIKKFEGVSMLQKVIRASLIDPSGILEIPGITKTSHDH